MRETDSWTEYHKNCYKNQFCDSSEFQDLGLSKLKYYCGTCTVYHLQFNLLKKSIQSKMCAKIY